MEYLTTQAVSHTYLPRLNHEANPIRPHLTFLKSSQKPPVQKRNLTIFHQSYCPMRAASGAFPNNSTFCVGTKLQTHQYKERANNRNLLVISISISIDYTDIDITTEPLAITKRRHKSCRDTISENTLYCQQQQILTTNKHTPYKPHKDESLL